MPHDLTRDDLISALKPCRFAAPKPAFLRDVLRMKRNRGDADADQFKAVACYDFAVKLNATIDGAAWAMRQWIAKSEKLGWSETKKAQREAFLADLDAVLAGDLTGWDINRAAA